MKYLVDWKYFRRKVNVLGQSSKTAFEYIRLVKIF